MPFCQSLWWPVCVFCTPTGTIFSPLALMVLLSCHAGEAWTLDDPHIVLRASLCPNMPLHPSYSTSSDLWQSRHTRRKSPLTVPDGKWGRNLSHIQPTSKPRGVFLVLRSLSLNWGPEDGRRALLVAVQRALPLAKRNPVLFKVPMLLVVLFTFFNFFLLGMGNKI